MSDGYRVTGSIVGIDELFVDVTVSNVNIDGDVTLTEKTESEPRVWTTTYETFHEKLDGREIARLHNIQDPDHDMWATLQAAWDEAAESPHSDAKAQLRSNIKPVFTTLLSQHTA